MAKQLNIYSTRSSVSSKFDIRIQFEEGLSARQRKAFSKAADRWSKIIVGNLAPVMVEGERIDDLLIIAKGSDIDGRRGILGQAGPTHLRENDHLPARGLMSFDIADLKAMEDDGTLADVICHEMGHVLGVGTLWKRNKLVRGIGSNDPIYIGKHASREYGKLKGQSKNIFVPVANTGGPGTRDAHWREEVFGNELMSGFISSRGNPISRTTVASLKDIGYEVDLDKAEAYELPSWEDLVEIGAGSALRIKEHGGHGMMFIPDQEVLSKDALL